MVKFSKNELEFIQDMAVNEIDQYSDETFIDYNVNPDEFFAKLRDLIEEAE